MVQPLAPQASAANASVTNVAVPPPTEQIKTSGIKPAEASSVTSTEELNTTTPDNENQTYGHGNFGHVSASNGIRFIGHGLTAAPFGFEAAGIIHPNP